MAFLIGAAPVGAVAVGAGPAAGQWIPPVDGPVARGFDPPDSRFGPGHLGVDFAVPAGTTVVAAGDGVVVFAGRVGAALHIVTKHAGDVRTSDSFLASISVVAGQAVRRGEVLGTSGGTGPGHAAGVLHFGVRVGAEYVDPMLLFARPDLGAVVHLAEPHHGARGAAGPGPTSERAALTAEIRVDGDARAAPPPWWNDPPNGEAVPVPAGPGTAAVPVATSSRASVPGVASSAVGVTFVAASAAGLVLRRRRRRGPR